jgi:hypothetical protein
LTILILLMLTQIVSFPTSSIVFKWDVQLFFNSLMHCLKNKKN